MPDTWVLTFQMIYLGRPILAELPTLRLRRNLRTQNTLIRENAYKAIVRPQLEYAAPVWDPHTRDDIHKIESVQRRGARWVLGDYSPYSSVTDMIGKLGWRNLEQRRSHSRLVLFL